MLEQLLRRILRDGRLTVHIGDSRGFVVGDLPLDAPHLDLAIRLRDRWTAAKIALDPEFQFGETFMTGELSIERGTLPSLLELIGRNFHHWRMHVGAPSFFLRLIGDRFQRSNSPTVATSNAQHHYDLDGEFYRQFLDADMQYSCAYFERPSMSLEDAQAAKKQHIIAKLAIEPGHTVLDIGSGWGGLALSIAKASPNVSVLGVTLSAEQLRFARQRAKEAALDGRVQFELCDYREVAGKFDRIVSVGMFEHVGRRHLPAFYSSVSRLLEDDGAALIHSIGRRSLQGSGSNPWINKHIFPGGYLPGISEAIAAIERNDLWVTDVEVLRLHYAETLRCWRERFTRNRSSIRTLYDEEFCRMWEFYLSSCEMLFRQGDLMVFQTQIAKRLDALPVTRDYMTKPESAPTAEQVLQARVIF